MMLGDAVGRVLASAGVGRILLGTTEVLRRSRSLPALADLQRTAALGPAEARRYQWSLLSRLLSHAVRSVPYYQEMFSSLGITAEDVRSLEDFARLPVLTKGIVRDRWRDLVASGLSPDSLVQGNTGGSTGIPLKFYLNKEYFGLSLAATYRTFAQSGWRPGEMVAFFWGGNDRLDAMSPLEFELRQYLRRMYQLDPFHSGNDDMAKWLRRWPRIGATVAYGYASTIGRFARFVIDSGVRVPPLKGVFTTAEKLYPVQRELIERAFRTRVYDCYGSSEVMHIATQCRLGSMHVMADFVHLEELRMPADDAGAPVPLVVTSLRNYAMPFLRYRTEDLGTLAAGACECGCGFPLMTLGVGRTSDNFLMPNGRVVHGEFFTHLMYGHEGVASFQFHQPTPERVDLYYVSLPGATPGARERLLRSVVEQVEALAPGQVTVSVKEVTSIPLSSAGKHRFTRSDVCPASPST